VVQLRSLIFLLIAFAFTVCPCLARSYAEPRPSFDQAADLALNERLYANAEELYSRRISDPSFDKLTVYNQIGLRVGLAEALFWQNEFASASQQVQELMPLVAKLESTVYSADDYFVKQKDLVLISRVLDIKAWLEQCQGVPDLAIASLDKAIASLKSSGASEDGGRRLNYCRAHLASILAGLVRTDDAIVALEDIVASERDCGGLFEIEKSNVYKTLASLLLNAHQPAKAADYFSRAYKIDASSELVNERYHPEIYLSDTNATFIEGAPWSSLKNFQKLKFKCIDLPLVSVCVALASKGNLVDVGLEVKNKSSKNIEFLGRKPELIVVSSSSRYATLLEPINHIDNGKAFWPQLQSDMAPSGYSNLPLSVYGLGGFVPPVVNYGGTIGGTFQGGEKYNPHPEVDSTIAQRVLDQEKALKKIGVRSGAVLRARSLTPQDIPAGGKISGNLHFVTDCAAIKGYVLQLPIGQTVFVFGYPSK
jgi:tetratricopeptide (TPR) repeat protein